MAKRAAPDKDGPLLLLDGMSLAFRAFFALPPEMKTRDGIVTNAAHGFMGMLAYLVRDHFPSGLAVAFDPPGPTFRDEVIAEYKGGRDATPPELEPQFGIINDLLDSLSIPVVSKVGYEADDVLATLATRARDAGRDVIVVTGDRDCFQLVEDPHVRVLYNRRGVSDYSLYDEAGIIERTGVEPARYPLLAALRGDPSDNLPGVPGVGEKTAARLLTQFEDFEALFDGLGQLTPKLRENLAANEELARRNATVMVLVRDVELDVADDELALGGWRREQGRAAFEAVEMRTQWNRIEILLDEGLFGTGADGETAAVVHESQIVGFKPTDDALELIGAAVARSTPLVVAASFAGDDATAMVVGDATTSSAATVEPATPEGRAVLGALAGARIAGHDLKPLWRAALALGVDLGVPAEDTAIEAYLLDSSSGRYRLEEVLTDATGDVAPWLAAAQPATLMDAPEVEDEEPRACRGDRGRERRVRTAAQRTGPAVPARRHGELPLLRVLARMEHRGIRVDAAVLRGIAEDRAEAASLEDAIHAAVGHDFQINSTKQPRPSSTRRTRPHEGPQDQDRLLDRRRDVGGTPR